ncbi:MAG: tRNA lysidine(34) synthetase TilS [Erysipelotrichales bacterium]|nr:tRNA lysidine(34) synthetase TilS [Erysipelotrichales bacterium]
MLDLNKSKKYLLACSYGPDSMALFDMLLKEGFYFEVAHVNYHKRDVSDFEEESLREICLKHGINLYVLDTHKIEKSRGNFQAWARSVRYEFFAKCLKENNLDAVLTAHHLDDLLETYLMQELRRGIVTYYGIQKETSLNNCPVVRPLLNFTKKELYDYCKENQIPFSIDVSNLSNDYTRNKIRHERIELMTKKEKIDLKKIIDEKNIKLMDLKGKLETHINENNHLCLANIDTDNLYNWDILLNLFLEANNVSYRVSLKQSNEILKVIKSNKPNVEIRLGKNKNIIKDYNFLKITDNLKVKNYKYIMEAPTKLDTEYFTLDLTKNYQQFRIKEEDFPLTIRNCQQGDMSYINNIPKKVSRLYIDWKMPRHLRERWPLIFNKNNELVYIIRYYGAESLVASQNFIVKK